MTIDVKTFWKFAGSSHLNRTRKQAAEKWHQQFIELKERWLKSYKKSYKNKRLTKDINDMRAVINTLAPSVGEEGTKTIGYLKRHMVLMEEENIKLFNEKKNTSKKIPK